MLVIFHPVIPLAKVRKKRCSSGFDVREGSDYPHVLNYIDKLEGSRDTVEREPEKQ